MYYKQVLKETAPIQLSKSKTQAINTEAKQEMRAAQKTPPEIKFRSIFTPLWESSVREAIQAQPLQMKIKKLNPHDNISTTIQRQTETSLKSDQLNVVGENHRESSQRRDEEKNYCRDYSNSSDYWEESEFQDSDGNFGDSIKLRFLHLQKLLESQVSGITVFEIYPYCNYQIAECTWVNLMEVLIFHSKLIKDLWILLQRIISGEADVEFQGNEQEKKYFEDLIPQMKDIAVTRQSTYSYHYNLRTFFPCTDFIPPTNISFDWAQGGQAVKVEKVDPTSINKHQLINYKLSVDALVNALIQKGLYSEKGQEEINQERSDAMHSLANKLGHKKGVWKIGDLHVEHIEDDIKKGLITKKDYNLVKRNKFNEHFYTIYPHLNPDAKPPEK